MAALSTQISLISVPVSDKTIEELANVYNCAFANDKLHLCLYRTRYGQLDLDPVARESLFLYKCKELHLYMIKRSMITLACYDGDQIVGFAMFRMPKGRVYKLHRSASRLHQAQLSFRYSFQLWLWFLFHPRIFRRQKSLKYAFQRALYMPTGDRTFHIYHIAVLPEFQGKGIGSQLIDKVISIVKELPGTTTGTSGLSTISLETLYPSYYSRFGFKTTTVIPFDDMYIHVMTKLIS